MAQLRRLREQFPNELVVIGVHSAKFPSEHLTANIRQAIMRYGIEHPVVNDTGFRVWSEYNVNAWPTLILIDPHGRIAGEKSGEILAEDLAGEIAELINLNREYINTQPVVPKPEMMQEPARPLEYPAKLLLAPGGNLFIADSGHNRIIQVQLDLDPASPAGEIVRVFGSGQPGLQDGPAAEARFNHPHGLAIRGSFNDGTLFVADTENHAIRAIDLESGQVRTVAGTGQKAHGRFTLGIPTETPLRSPWALVSYEEYLFIAMAGSHQIWVMLGEERLGPFAGTGAEALVDGPVGQSAFNQPSDIALGMGHLLVADAEASAIRAIALDEQPHTLTLVGQGLFEFGDQDGSGETARLQHPAGLAYDEETIYIADTYNHKIKALDPTTGEVKTLIGNRKPGSADGSFRQAGLFEPEGIQVALGKAYIADTNNHLIRIADLDTHQLRTLLLRGLEKLAMVPGIEETQPEKLPAVEAAPGTVQVTLKLSLPAGYKRNPEAPASVQVFQPDGQPQRYRFDPQQEITFPILADKDDEVLFELTLYYCETANQGVCLIHDRKLLLPLKVSPTGQREIRSEYLVRETG